MIRTYFARNIGEIRASRALVYLGFFLALAHVDTAISLLPWINAYVNSSDAAPLCWPFFPDCSSVRFLDLRVVHAGFVAYLVISLVTAGLFAGRRALGLAYGLLLLVTVSKWLLVLNDFRNMGNPNFMHLTGAFVYLLLPAKRSIYPLTVVAFYLAASMLKFNEEWLSGSALGYGLPFGPAWLFRFCTAFVVVLESTLIFGLLSRRSRVALAVFGLLIVFHAVSYYWVGYLYPSFMVCLLSFFPLDWYFHRSFGQAGREFRDGRLPAASYVFLALFALCQIYPWTLTNDPAVTGEGRPFALNMIDAKVECEYSLISRFRNVTIDESPRYTEFGVRLRCDPIVFWNKVQTICSAGRPDPDFINVDVFLDSRRTSEIEYRPILSIHDACTSFIYRPFLPNRWIGL